MSLRRRVDRLAEALEPEERADIIVELVPITYDENGDPIDVFEVTYDPDPEGDA